MHDDEFQSLFSWKSPSDTYPGADRLAVQKFQSLFSWKSPSDNGWRNQSEGCQDQVSILVFVEVALGQGLFLPFLVFLSVKSVLLNPP